MVLLSGFQLGVCASVLGSFCGTLGGQLRISALAREGRAAACLQLWGMAIWLVGQALGQVAILCAPATVAACVTFSSSLLCNALLAPLVLQEKLTFLHGVGISMLSVGGTAVTWAAAQENHEFNSWRSLRALLDRRISACAVALCYAVAALLCVHGFRRRSLDMVSFAYLFALCGSTDLLVTKFTLQLCRLQVMAVDRSELPHGLITSALVALMMAMHGATFGFQVASVYYRKALQSLPLFLGSGAIMQISLCGIFFREFDFNDRRQALVFGVGVSLVLGGLLVTSQAAPPAPEDEEEEETEGSPERVPKDGLPVAAAEAGEVGEAPAVAAPDASTPPGKKRPPRIPGSRGESPVSVDGELAAAPFSELPLPQPVLSGCGKLSRSSSLSSTDLLFVGELQRGAVVFGGARAPHLRGDTRFGSWDSARRQPGRTLTSPMSSPSLLHTERNGADGLLLPPIRSSSLQEPLIPPLHGTEHL